MDIQVESDDWKVPLCDLFLADGMDLGFGDDRYLLGLVEELFRKKVPAVLSMVKDPRPYLDDSLFRDRNLLVAEVGYPDNEHKQSIVDRLLTLYPMVRREELGLILEECKCPREIEGRFIQLEAKHILDG